MKFMKKIIVVSICIILLVISGCFIYFNSDSYKYKLARQYRVENINRMNDIPRLYIYEGVYSFESYATNKKTFKDKFGELVTTENTYHYGTGEVSFKSDKIIIILNDEREEINLTKPIIRLHNEKSSNYYFPIVQWQAYNNDRLFFQFDTTEYIADIHLFISKNDYDEVSAEISVFQRDNPRRKPQEVPVYGGKGGGFIILPYYRGSRIDMSNLKYKYDDPIFTSIYVQDATYAPEEYDIEEALTRVKRSSFKNPFILKKSWK